MHRAQQASTPSHHSTSNTGPVRVRSRAVEEAAAVGYGYAVDPDDHAAAREGAEAKKKSEDREREQERGGRKSFALPSRGSMASASELPEDATTAERVEELTRQLGDLYTLTEIVAETQHAQQQKSCCVVQ